MKEQSLFYRLTRSMPWNLILLLLSSAGITFFSLLLAIGNGYQVMFFDYFHYPLTFIMNWIPILLVQTLLWFLTGRQWLGFFLSGLVFLTASVGNYFKIVIRYEPFSFSDISFIGTALGVSGEYDLSMNSRMILMLAYFVPGCVLLALLAKRKPGRTSRIVIPAVILLTVFPLWKGVYASDALYSSRMISQRDNDREMDKYISKGFVYPFLHSIKNTAAAVPEGYDERKAAAVLESRPDSGIPDDRKISIIAVQLEAFADLRTMGISGISDEAYAYYDLLKEESLSGTLFVNVNGGTTIDTEQCFLTGDYQYYRIRTDTPSFVWYLRNQGYQTVGGHPYPSYYRREFTNPNLGFQDYRFSTTYDGYTDISEIERGEFFSDSFFFDSILEQYLELSEKDAPVFSFNVTVQGHSPFNSSEYLFGDGWFDGSGCSPETDFAVNNYLGSLADTQTYLRHLIDGIREAEEPAVIVLYGDHKPMLGKDSVIAEELNVNYDISTEEGLLNYYTTEYLIWGNNAAREMFGSSLIGEGPRISVCYLFPLLFRQLGWDGCGYGSYLLERMDTLNILSSTGAYFENDVWTSEENLTPAGREALQTARWVQYYRYSHPSQLLERMHQEAAADR